MLVQTPSAPQKSDMAMDHSHLGVFIAMFESRRNQLGKPESSSKMTERLSYAKRDGNGMAQLALLESCIFGPLPWHIYRGDRQRHIRCGCLPCNFQPSRPPRIFTQFVHFLPGLALCEEIPSVIALVAEFSPDSFGQPTKSQSNFARVVQSTVTSYGSSSLQVIYIQLLIPSS